MELDTQLLNHLRHVDAHTVPSGDDDLFRYVQAYLGVSIPRVSVCKGHSNPFQLVSDVFFGRQQNVIAFANRGGSKTYSVGILCHLLSVLFPLYEIAVVAAEKQQASRTFEYVQAFSNVDNPWFGEDRVYSTISKTAYRNGSTVQILTGSLRGCKSSHPITLILDEAEVMDWSIIQESFMMPMSKGGYSKLQVILSTRQFASGNMYKLLVERPKQPSWSFKVYPWCCFESCEKCTLPSCEPCKKRIRVRENGELESWHDVCHEEPERHPDGKCRASDGFIRLEDIWDLFVTADADVFDTQQRCKAPGRKGLVFSSFDRLVHCQDDLVKEWRNRLHHDRWEADPERRALKLAVLMDPGWAAPLGVLWVAKDRRDNLYYFDSIYQTELADRDLVPMILERFKKYNMPQDFPIRCDERESKEIAELCELGLKVSAIWLSPDERVRLLRKWLDGNYREAYPGICVDPDACKPFCVELETLKLKLDKEGNPKDEMPDKGADHLVDCAGYGFAELGLTGGLQIKLLRAKKPETPPSRLSVPTRSDWMNR